MNNNDTKEAQKRLQLSKLINFGKNHHCVTQAQIENWLADIDRGDDLNNITALLEQININELKDTINDELDSSVDMILSVDEESGRNIDPVRTTSDRFANYTHYSSGRIEATDRHTGKQYVVRESYSQYDLNLFTKNTGRQRALSNLAEENADSFSLG